MRIVHSFNQNTSRSFLPLRGIRVTEGGAGPSSEMTPQHGIVSFLGMTGRGDKQVLRSAPLDFARGRQDDQLTTSEGLWQSRKWR